MGYSDDAPRWHMREQYGFIMADVRPLPFFQCQGALGIWDFDEAEKDRASYLAKNGLVAT